MVTNPMDADVSGIPLDSNGELPVGFDVFSLTPAQRWELVGRMTMVVWASRGAAIPVYSRQDMPVRIMRRRSSTNTDPSSKDIS